MPNANLFPEWQEQHKDDVQTPKILRDMYAAHGTAEIGQICKFCIHLARFRYSRTYIKCEKSKMTHGPATDWKANWQACGLYEYTPFQRIAPCQK